MSSQQLEAPNRGVNIVCPKCGAVGVVLWEGENNERRSLVSVSKNFSERISKKNPYPIELVCHNCGMAQPENCSERPDEIQDQADDQSLARSASSR